MPHFVAFGAGEISVGFTTRFLVLLLNEIATSSGVPPTTAVRTAKKELQDRAEIESDKVLKKFADDIVHMNSP